MSYFYLQVDRLDGETPGAIYYPLGCKSGNKLTELVARWLEVYRNKGFRIIHFSHRPGYKQATRADGVKLELLVIMRETPFPASACNVGFEKGDDDDNTVLH